MVISTRAKYLQTEKHHQDIKQNPLRQPTPVPPQTRISMPCQHQWRDQQCACGITQPPGNPDGPHIAPGSEPIGNKTHNAYRGADGRAQNCGEKNEPDHAGCVLEAVASACKLFNQPGANYALEGIANGNT